MSNWIDMGGKSSTGRKCWAAVLGGCSAKISKEHYISKNQFSGDVKIQGFDWCRDPVTIGVGSLVSKLLCEAHNHELSDVDAEAGRFLLVQKDIGRRTAEISAGASPSNKQVVLSGTKLERWFLKTTINLALLGAKRDPGLFDDSGAVREELVRHAFGLSRFDPPLGLQLVAELKDVVEPPGGVAFTTITSKRDDEAVVAAVFRFHGHRFMLAFPGGPEVVGAIQPINRVNHKHARFRLRFSWR